MLVDSIGFSGAWLVKPNIYEDARGFFYEGYSRKDFLEYGLPDNFIQDGYSYNAKKIHLEVCIIKDILLHRLYI